MALVATSQECVEVYFVTREYILLGDLARSILNELVALFLSSWLVRRGIRYSPPYTIDYHELAITKCYLTFPTNPRLRHEYICNLCMAFLLMRLTGTETKNFI